MTGLVYLRSGFGFSFLRPKSVFLALTWAFCLYTAYARIDGAVWRRDRAMLLFGSGAFTLYWFHLAVAFIREWNQTGEHDQYSGTSHAVWLLRLARLAPSARLETRVHLWMEPLAVLLAALVLRLCSVNGWLTIWLLAVAGCLWSKEALNHWYRLRHQKRWADVFADAEEAAEPPTGSNPASGPPRAVRKTGVRRPRIADETTTDNEERRHA